ncbi:hypothetical protein LJR039_007248 [Pseudorhodoferax sp. LjRoot39]|uniref:hypothetical protein n=1 Tax=Pseudorhodoferax sp. LjRoot39 TaxID=3342328 RepID=UPI003ECC3572
MVIDLQDWLVAFQDAETEQRIKIPVEAGNPVAAVDAAMRILDARLLGRRDWLVMDSCASLNHGDTDA